MLTACLWLVLAQGVSQAPRDSPAVGQSEVNSLPQQDPEYRLGPQDVLAISVLGLAEFRQPNQPWLDVVVSNSGKIHIPHAGVISVVGRSTSEVQAEIAKSLRDRNLVRDPQVTVRVKSYLGNTIYILGEVLQPGQYYMRRDMYILDLLGLSMGFPTEGIMYFYRRGQARKTPESDAADPGAADSVLNQAIPIDIAQMSEGKQPGLNFKLKGGDILYVPYNRPKYMFVTGEVHKAGSFEIPPRRQLLVSEAIAFAGGPTKTAKISKGILVRYDPQGSRQELALDFKAILRGKSPDLPVRENDIIFIPGSNVKTLGQGFLSIIPNIATLALW